MSEIQEEFESLPFRTDAEVWDVLDTGDEAGDLSFGRQCAERLGVWLDRGGDMATALHVVWLAAGGLEADDGPKTIVARGFLDEIRRRLIGG